MRLDENIGSRNRQGNVGQGNGIIPLTIIPLTQPPGVRTHYIYDGMRVIQERDVNNNPTVSYTRGSDLSGSLEGAGGIGGLLARSHGYSLGNWSTHNYYHADGNGNITYLVNSSQTLAASYRYDPFGNTLTSSGTLASANVYRFSSKERVGVADYYGSEIYYYGYRFYEPALQRWLNRDPVGEIGFGLVHQLLHEESIAFPISELLAGSNPYRFVSNDPLGRFDLLGLASICDTLAQMMGSELAKPDPSRIRMGALLALYQQLCTSPPGTPLPGKPVDPNRCKFFDPSSNMAPTPQQAKDIGTGIGAGGVIIIVIIIVGAPVGI